MAKTVAFIGLGNMGGPMAANIIKAGYHVHAFDVVPDLVKAAVANGAEPVRSAREAMDGADAAITMLPAAEHALAVWADILPAAKPGMILIDCSTIDVESARKLHSMAGASRCLSLDAPVSGGVNGAKAGTLTIMCGGSKAAFEAAKPFLDGVVGKRVIHCGDVGAGQAAKICNNMILGVSMIAVSEAFLLAEKLGLSAQAMFDVVSTASGQCWSLTTYCPVPGPVPASPANNGYKPGFSAALMLKDLKLAQQAAAAAGAATPLGAEAAQIYALFNNAGGSGDDFSGVIRYLRGGEGDRLMLEEIIRAKLSALAFLLAAAAIAIPSGWIFASMREAEPIVPGLGVTERHMLSERQPSIKGSDGDTPYYVFDSGKPGPTLMVLGGTHPPEIAGMMAAVILVENARVTQGKLVVVPQANRSGFTHTDPMGAFYHSYEITRPDGSKRWFRVGMRLSNPADQWPDPTVYVHMPTGEKMIGQELRNLNRNHPGLGSGTLTAEVSHGITTLAREADIVFDLHEAQPENTLNNIIIAHERAVETASYAVEFFKAAGLPIKFDKSPANLHGLSHREFGDFTKAQALLAETTNPAMGYFRGRLSMDLLVGGKDPNYVEAAKMKRLFNLQFDEFGWPLEKRVARHLKAISDVLMAYNELHPRAQLLIEGIPSYDDMVGKGLGAFLNPPPK